MAKLDTAPPRSVVGRWLLLCLLLLGVGAFTATAQAAGDESAAATAEAESTKAYVNVAGSNVPNPGTELWRAVRAGPPAGVGSSQAQGVGSDTLVAESGEAWRIARQDYLIPYGGWLLVAVLLLILVFHMSRHPPEKFDASGGKIQRFEVYDRILHWLLAGLFIFLGLTGLVLLIGRFVVLPVFGPEAFGAIASACKEGHNLFGPIFIVALWLFFVRFVARNWYARGDIDWMLKGGGMLGGKHPSAGFFNAGEKMLFWAVIVGGVVLCVSGLILVFPQFGQARELMQDMMLLHGIAAVGLIAFVFGHIYLATVGVPGTLDSMNSGKVDANWARVHHDRWARQAHDNDMIEKQEQ